MGEESSALTLSGRPARRPLLGVTLALLVSPASGTGASILQEPDTVAAPDTIAAQPQDTAGVQVPDSVAALETAVDTPRTLIFPVFPDVRANSPGTRFNWTTADILNTGALTLADLLEIVPTVDPIRVGFLEGPQTSVFAGGGPVGLRLSIDGYHIVPLFGGPLDQHQVSLVEQEGARLVREPGGTQMALQTYRNRKTSPYSRIEAGTGDRNANLLRGYFSSWLASTLLGFGFDRIDTRGSDELGSSQRTLVYASLAHKLPLDSWAQLEVRRTVVTRDSFPSPSRTDWVARLRRSFGEGWVADLTAGTGKVTVEQIVPPGEPDSLFPDIELDAQQLTFRGARNAESWQATAAVRLWAGEGVPNLETEATLSLDLGPASLFGSGRYADWDSFNVAAGYAAARLQLPLGFALLAEIEEGDRGLYNAAPVPREEFTRWSLGGELRIGSWTLGGYGGIWDVIPSPSLDIPYDTGFALVGGSAGVAELWANGVLFKLFGGTISGGGRYSAREAGAFIYWPQDEWRLEGQYRVAPVGDQLEIILKGIGGIRGGMQVPDPDSPNAVRVSEDLTWLWSELIVRIKDARIFFTYETFDAATAREDIPSFILPRARTHFGLKWEFWN